MQLRDFLVLPCVFGTLAGCGTAYDIPTASPADQAQARALFMEETNRASSGTAHALPQRQALRQFETVLRRVEPVAEAFFRAQTTDIPDFNCDMAIYVDQQSTESNAYQSYDGNGQPYIAFTIPLILDARTPDEIAFVLGHEYGHHIARHIDKQQQQALAGALVAGVLMASTQAYASSYDPYRNTSMDQYNIELAMAGGAALGQIAYSQTYELESDLIGTYIASAAGYDPVEGARFFARPEQPRTVSGSLSFWGTHPPSEARLANVIAVRRLIDSADQQ